MLATVKQELLAETAQLEEEGRTLRRTLAAAQQVGAEANARAAQEAKRHQQSAAVAQLRELQAQSSALSASVRKLEQDKAQATRGIAQAQKQRAEQDLALEQTEAEIAQIDRKLAAEETRIKQLTAHLVTLHASGRTPQDDAKRTRELEASVVKLKQRCAEKQRELQNEQFEHERLSSIIEALT